MKVLYLTHQYFPRHVGGTEVYTRSLVRRAVAAGHQARVIACHENPSGNAADFHVCRTQHEGVPLAEIHFNLSVTDHPPRDEYDNRFVYGVMENELQSFQPDIVHATHAMKLSGSALEACHAVGVPTIVTLCDFWFLCHRHTFMQWDGSVCNGPTRPFKCLTCAQRLHGFAAWPKEREGIGSYVRDVWTIEKRKTFLRRNLLQARRIIALSHFQKRMFVKNGYPANRIEVIAHGLETNDLRAAHVTEAQSRPHPLRKIGFIASLVPHKGAHVLLAALAAAPDLPITCHIHGPLPEGDEYVGRLQAMSQRDPRVRLMGGFDPSQLGRVLRSFDVLAVPALWHENDPLVVKAALHLGVPVLASRIGSLEEMITEGRNGWLVPPDNPAAWARAIQELSERPLPAFAPANVKTMDENAQEILQIYEQEARKR